jgi:hypothetical protein
MKEFIFTIILCLFVFGLGFCSSQLYLSYKEDKIAIKKQIDTDNCDLMSAIKNNFEFTHNVEDIIVCNEVYAILNGIDKKKINNELNAMNIFKKKSTKGGSTRNKYCFFGIKEKSKDEE